MAHAESSFSDADALLTGTQDVGLIWDITRGTYAQDIVEKAFKCESISLVEKKMGSLFCGIHEVEFAHVILDNLGNNRVFEELVDCFRNLGREMDLGSAVCLWIVVEDLFDEELNRECVVIVCVRERKKEKTPTLLVVSWHSRPILRM